MEWESAADGSELNFTPVLGSFQGAAKPHRFQTVAQASAWCSDDRAWKGEYKMVSALDHFEYHCYTEHVQSWM